MRSKNKDLLVRKGPAPKPRMSPQEFTEIGAAMFGSRWQAELARQLNTPLRTLQTWAAEGPLESLRPELLRIGAARIQRIENALTLPPRKQASAIVVAFEPLRAAFLRALDRPDAEDLFNRLVEDLDTAISRSEGGPVTAVQFIDEPLPLIQKLVVTRGVYTQRWVHKITMKSSGQPYVKLEKIVPSKFKGSWPKPEEATRFTKKRKATSYA